MSKPFNLCLSRTYPITTSAQVHHSERYEGVPYGLFLGPQELEAVGGGEYLDQLVEQLDMSSPTTR